MGKSRWLVIAAISIAVIAAGVLIASAGIRTETPTPPGPGNNGTEGPRNFVVNVTDSIEVQDR